MTKKYATSVYSQKSTVSAKSGRSFLSMNNSTSIKPLFNKNKNSNQETETMSISLEDTKNSIWKNFKSLIPTATPITKKKNNVVLVDNFDTSTIKSSTSSTSMNLNKWKKILVSPTQYLSWSRDNNKTSPVSSLKDQDNNNNNNNNLLTTTHSSNFIENHHHSIHEKHLSISSSTSSFNNQPVGILVNHGGETEQEIAEQKKRRHERRLYLMRVQQRDNVNHRHSFSSIGSIDYNKRQVGFTDHIESSSSTLLPTPPDDSHVKIDDKLDFYNENNNNNNNNTNITTALDGSWYSAPRVMFVEPSPVPRFRNEPPAPPPSPPYLNVIVQPLHLNNNEENNNTNNNNNTIQSLITNEDNHQNDNNEKDNNIPTIYTTLPLSSSPDQYTHHLIEKQQHILNPPPLQKSRLIFHSPLKRGQTLSFSLENAIPEDHIVIFKFLTSNSVLIPKRRKSSSSSFNYHQQQHQYGLNPSSSFITSNNNSNIKQSIASTERYFVRPSAGKIDVGQSHSDILLFLNQVPPLNPGDMLKDKILVRWAVVQRGTQVEAWVNQLKESTRRKWLEMLLEKWPDQVIERKTRISIRFV